MQVEKKFGLASTVIFDGSIKAINIFTRIHQAISQRGYGILLPGEGKTETFSLPWVGTVILKRENSCFCKVQYSRGPLRSGLSHMFAGN